MAIKLEVYKNATVRLRNGDIKQYAAIYPTYNGLVTGTLIEQENLYTKSVRRRFGKSKPVKEQLVSYHIFEDSGFLRDGSYTFFNGERTFAYTDKLTNDEIGDQLLYSML
jgi:hypothetical protein